MDSPRQSTSRMLVAGVAFIALGVVFAVLYRVSSAGESRVFTSDAKAPRYVHVTNAHTYRIAVPDGVEQLARLRIDPATVTCSATARGGSSTSLTLVAESKDSKAIDVIASFDAPFTGTVHVQCAGLVTVFVDNADDRPYDVSGAWLVLATIALAVGVALTASGLRRRLEPVSG